MRVVSLVPSLTEAVALTVPDVLVGATDWCTHPPGLSVARVGGSKYPDLDRVLALRPDVVLVNVEENRHADAAALSAAGVHVYVTYPHTVEGALDELGRLLTFLGAVSEPAWLVAAHSAWAALPPPTTTRQAIVAVWRRPWIVLGGDTFVGDVLNRLGIINVYADHPERYPRPTLTQLTAQQPDLVVLPDEPYRFSVTDGPEAFGDTPCALISGRHLTWYGPSLADVPSLLHEQLAPTRWVNAHGRPGAKPRPQHFPPD